MNVSRITLAATRLRSLAWYGDTLADWIGGARYHLDGTREELYLGYSFRFDARSGHVVLFDGTPRLLELSTGAIVERSDDLNGGEGIHQPSVSMKPQEPPWLAMDPARSRFALGWPESIVVVSLSS
jgi:hypothetical protein